MRKRLKPRDIKVFQNTVLGYFKKHGRDLPWRNGRDPYRILVSEIMLQQTQVERVIPFYERFLARFPNIVALSRASFAEVYELWRGLGYNRRAKALRDLATIIAKEHRGVFPSDFEALRMLPGVGYYTAGAVSAFAFGKRIPIIETNIRTVYLHHFFPKRSGVRDIEILKCIEETLPEKNIARWYAALMDYGSHLKKTGIKLNHRSRTYTKQKPFNGSTRKLRGEILRYLSSNNEKSVRELGNALQVKSDLLKSQLINLEREGLVARKGSRMALT